MIKTIDIAGIRLDNYTVREAILILSRELSDQGFHTIEEVNTDLLLQAASDEGVRRALQLMEHTVISEVAILEAVGAATYQRKRELEHHDFFWEMMRLFDRNGKNVCLIGDSKARALGMEEKLRGLFPRCGLGSFALEAYEGDPDSLVNEINAAAPDVIISIMPSPAQERFFLEYREKLSAGLWYGIGQMNPDARMNGLFGMIHRRVRAHRLAKQLGSLRQERVEDERN